MAYSTGAIGRHESSHEELIEMVNLPGHSRSPSGRLDAIIVPAARPYRNLMTAANLAKATGSRLIVLCSLDTRPGDALKLFEAQGLIAGQGMAISVPPRYELPGLSLETTAWVRREPGMSVCGRRNSDLSVKRNIGLQLAHMLGWERIFFLDDDIRGISANELTRTVSLLGTYRSSGMHVERVDSSAVDVEYSQSISTEIKYFTPAGEEIVASSTQQTRIRSSSMQVKHFPDNSVVCHARREVGEHQDVFVSGSVLAVDCTAEFDFFPDLYNEDWLFFYRNAAERKLASPGVQATKIAQVKYNPFANWQRAEREEFGDVIAEGLYSLLHHGYGPHSPTEAYWTRFLGDRNAVLDGVSKQVPSAPVELQDGIEASISAARHTLRNITPAMCVDYVAAWQRDLVRWENRLRELPVVPSVEDALRELGLQPL